MESVRPMLNTVLNKPEEDTLEEVPPSPQPSPPAENTPWNTHPHVNVTDMLKKVQDVESKLSSLTLTKLDLMSFLEDITIELKLLKHKLQLPYHGHKFSITTPPSDSSDDEILDLVSIDENESPKDNDYVPVPFGTYLSPEAFNQELTEDKEVE